MLSMETTKSQDEMPLRGFSVERDSKRGRKRLGFELLETRAMLAADVVDLAIITHGFQSDGRFSAWVEDMGRAINDRAGYDCSPQQVAASRMTYSASAVAPELGCPNLLLFDWAEVSGLFYSGHADSDQVAGSLASFVRARLSDSVTTNLHFLGHSRGAYVVRAAIDRLTSADLDHVGWLQMTTFDPQAFGNDGPLNVPSSVDLADNYLQTRNAGIGGNRIPGAVNVDLTSMLDDWPGRQGSYAEHSEVHDWYHWTIDTRMFSPGDPHPYADVALATPVARELLFPLPAWELGGNAGYRWSIGGGAAAAWQTQPWTNHLLPTDVNLDGRTTAADVMAIVNEINENGAHELPVPRSGGEPHPPRIDISGDNRVSAFDVILAVNELNRAAALGEGESNDRLPRSKLAVAPEISAQPTFAPPLAAARIDSFLRRDPIRLASATDQFFRSPPQQPSSDSDIFDEPLARRFNTGE